MAVRNRLKYWRHQLQIDRKKDYAEFLGVSHFSISRWEGNTVQPDLMSLWKIYRRLKEKFPDLHLEDLIEEAPE